jgi:hypothetical protein
MKNLNLAQMENLQGGKMTWTWEQHILCALGGVIAGGGILGAAGYLLCLELLVS